jgi:RpiB/LacA/LacB family sugar-phosphate isomerase
VKIAVASDHAGFDLKELVRKELAADGHSVLDLGTDSATKPDDYPDFALAIGTALVKGQAERGVLICGSGVGASVAVNKIPGVRAGLCHDHYSAHQGVEHDDMNVLVLGARIIGSETAKDLVAAFLKAQYTGEERHARRLAKVKAIEANPPKA